MCWSIRCVRELRRRGRWLGLRLADRARRVALSARCADLASDVGRRPGLATAGSLAPSGVPRPVPGLRATAIPPIDLGSRRGRANPSPNPSLASGQAEQAALGLVEDLELGVVLVRRRAGRARRPWLRRACARLSRPIPQLALLLLLPRPRLQHRLGGGTGVIGRLGAVRAAAGVLARCFAATWSPGHSRSIPTSWSASAWRRRPSSSTWPWSWPAGQGSWPAAWPPVGLVLGLGLGRCGAQGGGQRPCFGLAALCRRRPWARWAWPRCRALPPSRPGRRCSG